MSRKKFLYLSAAAFLLLGSIGSALVLIFFGTGVSALFLVVFMCVMFGIPAIFCLIPALLAHSAEPFSGRLVSSSSRFLGVFGIVSILVFLVYFTRLLS